MKKRPSLRPCALRASWGGRGFQEFQRTLTLTEALAANWANIATIAVGLVICFAASYMTFLCSEIRPGG